MRLLHYVISLIQSVCVLSYLSGRRKQNKEKRKRREERTNFLSLFVYGCCPGGAWPAGFVAGVPGVPGFCSNPPPVQVGC
jgi:hypothetical protein